jgi:Cu-processing system permease protein
MIKTIAYYTLLESIRNRIFVFALVWIIILFGLTQFVGELALTERNQIQASILANLLRLSGVFLVTLFVATSMVREFQDKHVEVLLSLPLRRADYFWGKWLGYAAMAFIMAVLFGASLLIYAPLKAVLAWTASFIFELLLVSSMSLMMLFTFNQITLAVSSVMILYFAARCIDIIQLITINPLLPNPKIAQWIIDKIIAGLHYMLPSLNRFTLTDWLVYGAPGWDALMYIAVQTGIFIALLSTISLVDFYRKNI